MGDLSAHFSRREFLCHCGCRRGRVAARLVDGLERLRELAGGHPVRVTSGWRCEAHNAAVGGSPTSQHLAGLAADVVIAEISAVDLYRIAQQVPAFSAGGIGVYPTKGHLHVDVRRDGPARWAIVRGDVVTLASLNLAR